MRASFRSTTRHPDRKTTDRQAATLIRLFHSTAIAGDASLYLMFLLIAERGLRELATAGGILPVDEIH